MSTETASPSSSSGTGRFWLLIIIVLVVFAGLFALGLLPRLQANKARNAEENTIRVAIY